MPDYYHILPANAAYTSVTKPTRYPDEGILQTINAACGKTLTRYSEQGYCSVLIANPKWQKEWCQDCVRAFHWSQAVAEQWKTIHKIEGLPEPINSC